MNKDELIRKITEKKDFSKLPRKDVELAFSHFERRQTSDGEKIRLTKELLHKVFGAFGSRKLLSLKDRDEEWVLRKHLSTRERIGFYDEIYRKILDGEEVVFDLGAGINGFGYKYFGRKLRYIAVEAVGQWVDLMNSYFKRNNVNGHAVHLSLFEIEKIKEIIKKEKGEKKENVVFLFKVLDSLEIMDRDYSKKILSELYPFVSKIVVSFATESMGKRKKFRVDRKWILGFIKEKFEILDEFEVGSENFIVFCEKRKG